MDFKGLLASKKAKVAGALTALSGSVSAAINWTSTTDTVENAIGLIGTVVAEIVEIIPDIVVLVIMLAIAAFVGAFLRTLLGKIRMA